MVGVGIERNAIEPSVPPSLRLSLAPFHATLLRRNARTVLDHEGGPAGVGDESLEDLGAGDALLRVEVRRRLVDEVHVSGAAEAERHGNALQLAPREPRHLRVGDLLHAQRPQDVGDELGVGVGVADARAQELLHGPAVARTDLLRLVGHAQRRAREALRGPPRRRCVLVRVALEEPREHANEGGLARAVLAQQHDDL